VQGLTWGLVHTLLRRNPRRYLPRLAEQLSTPPGDEVVQRLGPDTAAMAEFLLTCRSDHGYRIDMRAPTDVTGDVRQPTLVLASPNDGAVGMEHSE
jgi:hypothetical protein